MGLTQEQILERLDAFTLHTQRIQELKDLLLDFTMLGTQEELDRNERHQDEVIAEIRRIYKDHLTPIIREIAEHVEEHQEEILEILVEYEKTDSDPTEAIEEFLYEREAETACQEDEAGEIEPPLIPPSWAGGHFSQRVVSSINTGSPLDLQRLASALINPLGGPQPKKAIQPVETDGFIES